MVQMGIFDPLNLQIGVLESGAYDFEALKCLNLQNGVLKEK